MNPFEEWLDSVFKKPLPVGPTLAAAPKWYPEMQNPERLKDVEKSMTPDVRNVPWLEQLYKSGVADTLYNLLGGVPQGWGGQGLRIGTDPKNVAFVSPLETLHMSPDREKYQQAAGELNKDPVTTFAHEIGHLMPSSKFPTLPELKTAEPPLWVFDPRWRTPGYGSLNFPSPYSKALQKIDSYYQTSSNEAFSQTFANTFDLLRKTAKGVPPNFREVLAEREALTPGLGIMLQDILQEPIYAKHPLRAVFRTPLKKEKKK